MENIGKQTDTVIFHTGKGVNWPQKTNTKMVRGGIYENSEEKKER